jgi:hypothetical protein
MNLFREIFRDEKMRNFEVGILRAYLLFDVFQRVLTLAIDQAHDVGRHFGIW